MSCTLCQADDQKSAPVEGICAGCGSYPEDRAFAYIFRNYSRPESGFKVLDVAPPVPQLANLYKSRFMGEGRYTAIAPFALPGADRLKLPHRFLEMDITHLSFSDASFDIVICNHVLSYVRSDFLAMSELHRVLKARGTAFLNVTVEPGKSLRAGEGTGKPGTGREWRYGEDYFERLEAAGLFVLRLPLKNLLKDVPEGAGLPEGAEQVLCFKFRDAMEDFRARISG